MLSPRPPIIVILGHVDHGKTTLLDTLRSSSVAAREAGGITQAIRSFQPTLPNSSPLTFIDTPGHEAFSQMRSRGSHLADIAILVVAGNDGVMPQTKQSIQFIKQAKLPFIVAINKSDLDSFNPDSVKTKLTESEVIVEDLGGDVPTVNISAKTGAGLTDLTDLVRLISDLNPPQADPDGPLEAVVLESRLDPRKGPVAAVIVKNGTLILGQKLFQDQDSGKVKSLINAEGHPITSALPSTPVEILGLTSVPEVGSLLTSQPGSTVQTITPSPKIPTRTGSLNLVVKADVAGSLEAIVSSLPPDVNVIGFGTGDITESDIDLAKNSQGLVLGFNVKAGSSVSKLAEIDHVSVKLYTIIYELLDAVHKLLIPKTTEELLGKADILAEFTMNGQHIAGCRVTEGEIVKNVSIRILRDTKEVGVGRIKSLQSGKNIVDKAKKGTEFGAVISPNIDFTVGDCIIAFETHGTP